MRVAAAMSGGVDSSVAACLLAEEGLEVVGVTLKVWDDSRCCSLTDADDARRVARRLGIPHYVIDAREAFEEMVIAPFVATSREGRTPNPCVLCNRRLKFGWLAERVHALGCEALATGHYARIETGGDGRRRLLRGMDAAKDQSYFVVPGRAEQLDLLRFPVGEHTKTEIRRIAAERDLPTAAKPDSQDLCFLPKGGVAEFLSGRLGRSEPGEIVDAAGTVLGFHGGLHTLTVGQRKGLNLPSSAPLYVARKEPRTNRVVLAPRDALYADAFSVSGTVWLEPGIEGTEFPCAVRIRSTGALAPCRVSARGSRAEVRLSAPQFAVTPGQLAVFYDEDLVLGSGWIEG
jgi:tRNA-specific 2-thiouridylase